MSGASKLSHMALNLPRVHKGDLHLRPVLASNGTLRVEKYSDSTLNARLDEPRVTTKLHAPPAGVLRGGMAHLAQPLAQGCVCNLIHHLFAFFGSLGPVHKQVPNPAVIQSATPTRAVRLAVDLVAATSGSKGMAKINYIWIRWWWGGMCAQK